MFWDILLISEYSLILLIYSKLSINLVSLMPPQCLSILNCGVLMTLLKVVVVYISKSNGELFNIIKGPLLTKIQFLFILEFCSYFGARFFLLLLFVLL